MTGRRSEDYSRSNFFHEKFSPCYTENSIRGIRYGIDFSNIDGRLGGQVVIDEQ